MSKRVGVADVSPSSQSLLALKPRQVLIAELQRNKAETAPMAKTRSEEPFQLEAQEELILTCSIALWLDNKGLSKVLKRFISAVEIEGDDWKARALNLNEIFFKYLKNCSNLCKDRSAEKNPEGPENALAEKNGVSNSTKSVGIVDKKKKKKIEDAPVIDIGKTTEEIAISEKENGSELIRQNMKIDKTFETLSHGELKSKESKHSSDENFCDLAVEPVDGLSDKKLDKKKKKKNLGLRIVDEMTINAIPEMNQKNNGVLTDVSVGKGDFEGTPKLKDEKKRKRLKTNGDKHEDINGEIFNKKLLSIKKGSDIEINDLKAQVKKKSGKKKTSNPVDFSFFSGTEAPGSENLIDNKSREALVEPAEDMINESKKSSKKRKRISDDDEKLPTAIEESKHKKIKDVDPRITLPGSNRQAAEKNKEENFRVSVMDSENLYAKQTDELFNDHLNDIGAEKLGEPKSAKKKANYSAEPKSVNAFQRVNVDKVEFVDERLQDNSYWAKDGADTGYGAKAQEVLGQVKGRNFRHEKTKKKRGSYRGGQIDLQSHSVKFNYSDED